MTPASADPETAPLFAPLRRGGLHFPNRVVMAPMGTGLDEDGLIGDAVVEYYRRRAAGGTGTITVEATLIDPRTDGPEPRLHDEAHVPGMRRAVEAVHAHGALIGIQLLHPGRQAQHGALLAPSAIPLNKHAPVPEELTPEGIAEIVELYVRGAGLARAAGVDFVEIHGAHGYLLSDFLSPLANRRTDAYGGALEHRARFGREVVRAIGAAHPGLPVFYRLSAVEGRPGGLEVDEAVQVARWLEQDGVACISVSGGSWLALHVMLAPMHDPPGRLVPAAARVRAAVSVPVIVAGRLDDPRLAARTIADGAADLVAIGRGLIADPAWCDKVRAGRLDAVRPCLACNACVELVGPGGEIRCAVNPEVGREHGWAPAPADPPRRVAVIGAGPAGLEAARVARLRGHDVTLWERAERLGGKLELAAAAPSKARVLAFRDYQERVLEDLGVAIRTGADVTPEGLLALGFDATIVATGAVPMVPPIPGVDAPHVHDAEAFLRRRVALPAGARVVVIGGSATGCETAELLAADGAAVTIVELLPYVGKGIEGITRRHLVQTLRDAGAELLVGAAVTAIEPGLVRYRQGDADGTIAADLVALAVGWAPGGDALAAGLRGTTVHVAGDAHRPADFVAAVNAGADAGLVV